MQAHHHLTAVKQRNLRLKPDRQTLNKKSTNQFKAKFSQPDS